MILYSMTIILLDYFQFPLPVQPIALLYHCILLGWFQMQVALLYGQYMTLLGAFSRPPKFHYLQNWDWLQEGWYDLGKAACLTSEESLVNLRTRGINMGSHREISVGQLWYVTERSWTKCSQHIHACSINSWLVNWGGTILRASHFRYIQFHQAYNISEGDHQNKPSGLIHLRLSNTRCDFAIWSCS